MILAAHEFKALKQELAELLTQEAKADKLCDGRFVTAQVVVLNGILRHGIKHLDFTLESKNYARERKSFLDSVQRGDERLYTCYKNRLLFRIYHYKTVEEEAKGNKESICKEVHSFRTRYEINRIFYHGSMK